jgi:hypothetical protein
MHGSNHSIGRAIERHTCRPRPGHGDVERGLRSVDEVDDACLRPVGWRAEFFRNEVDIILPSAKLFTQLSLKSS